MYQALYFSFKRCFTLNEEETSHETISKRRHFIHSKQTSNLIALFKMIHATRFHRLSAKREILSSKLTV